MTFQGAYLPLKSCGICVCMSAGDANSVPPIQMMMSDWGCTLFSGLEHAMASSSHGMDTRKIYRKKHQRKIFVNVFFFVFPCPLKSPQAQQKGSKNWLVSSIGTVFRSRIDSVVTCPFVTNTGSILETVDGLQSERIMNHDDNDDVGVDEDDHYPSLSLTL